MEIMNSGTWDRIKGLVGVVSVGITSTGGSKDSDWRDIISTVQYPQGILVLTVTSNISREYSKHFASSRSASTVSIIAGMSKSWTTVPEPNKME